MFAKCENKVSAGTTQDFKRLVEIMRKNAYKPGAHIQPENKKNI